MSPSRILIESLLLAPSIVIPGSLAVMLFSVTVTVSVPSTRLSATMPVTSIVWLVDPADMVTVPDSAV